MNLSDFVDNIDLNNELHVWFVCFVWIGIFSICILILFYFFPNFFKNLEKLSKKEMEEIQNFKRHKETWNNFIEERDEIIDTFFSSLKNNFSKETLERMKTQKAWIGMTKEHLITMYGEPHEEESIDKRKDRFIYFADQEDYGYPGYEAMGIEDLFTFDNNKLISFEIKSHAIKRWERIEFLWEWNKEFNSTVKNQNLF